ncbi:hypothetical protein OH77DRAFT_829025 [Trametes cingulata]|nr:hypothetical protein OH77DRAFT_829025 [Trametes cingulata]
MPVVGTPEYQAWRQRQNAPRPVTAWTRGVPPALVPPAATRTASNSSAASDAGSRTSSAPQTLPREAWNNANAPLTPPGLPPGITRGGSSSGSSQRSAGSGRNGWEGSASQRSTSPVGTPSTSGSASSDDAPPATPADLGSDGSAVVVGDRIERAFAALDMDDEEDYYYSVGGGSVAGDGDGEGDGIVDPTAPPPVEFDLKLMPRASDVVISKPLDGPSTSSAPRSNAQPEGDDEDEDDDDENENDANPEICPEHNVVCKKGICRVAAARDRERKREARRQAREKERAEALARREKNAKKKGKTPFFKSAPSSASGSGSGASTPTREPPPHLRTGAPAAALRAPPAHLKMGAPPPPPSAPGSSRQMPAHLQRGASASSGPTSPPPPQAGEGDGRLTPTPSRRIEDDVRSEGSGWGNLSEGPWGPPVQITKGKARLKAPLPEPKPAPPPERAWGAWGRAPSISASSVRRNNDSWSVAGSDAPASPGMDDRAGGMTSGSPRQEREWGAWGKAPSISASSVRRNNDSWSVSAASEADDVNQEKARAQTQTQGSTSQRVWGAWGKAPSISASSVRRNNDSWSVSARSVAGGNEDDARSVAASDTGNWGRPPSVAGSSGAPRGSWADQMDEEDEMNAANVKGAAAQEDDDVRSVAASTESGWGSVSAGPW